MQKSHDFQSEDNLPQILTIALKYYGHITRLVKIPSTEYLSKSMTLNLQKYFVNSTFWTKASFLQYTKNIRLDKLNIYFP